MCSLFHDNLSLDFVVSYTKRAVALGIERRVTNLTVNAVSVLFLFHGTYAAIGHDPFLLFRHASCEVSFAKRRNPAL